MMDEADADTADAAVLRHPAMAVSEREVVELYHAEILGYCREMSGFVHMEPDEVLIHLSGWGARATEIRCTLARNEGRAAQAFRTKVLEPFLDQCEFQYKCHSRIVSIREFDLKLTGGAPA